MRKEVTIGFFLMLFSSPLAQADEQLKIDQLQISNLRIETENPVKVSSVFSRSFPGQIVIPNAQVRVLNPMLAGLVNILYVAEGDQIKKGQKLAEISSSDFLKAQQNYLQSLSALEIDKRNHERNEELLQEGIISEKSYLIGQANFQEANSAFYSSLQALEFSGMSEQQIHALQSSRKINNSMVITAPFDGVVLSQNVKTGQHVDEDVSLYHLGDLDPLWIEIHVPYMLRNSLQVGNAISIEGSSLDSKIITVGQMVHEEDQGIIVRGLLQSEQMEFIPGQYIKVNLEQKMEQGNYYRIPTGSVIRNGDEVSLFVKNTEGFLLKAARIVADEGNSLVIDADISEANHIAVKGIATLKGILEGLGSEE